MKRKVIIGLFVLLLINVSQLFAQGTPCGDSADPDSPQCPLDTWVLVLVAVFLVIATIKLYKKGQVGVVASDR